ncbi:MAG TPA: sugar phosphate nucleotidyltransferase [Clostridiales bacterium]|nr:sugar phosphate nucleotidyltransferase [Clostridiales bacterium]HQK72876.1 sugar phosphate nucleotidyltransferase [Clostridiales bacterium]
MKKECMEIFVPGRLCLFGEHSDWAGAQRIFNSAIVPGEAIVTGIEQGIRAKVNKHERFIIYSSLPGEEQMRLECPMSAPQLREIAREGGYYSYVAGVASYVYDNYSVQGLEICITERTLPVKRGLSSSAAICVLVAKAFNRLYDLHMSIKGEMQVAYYGEQRTPSRCGRLDQACAFGIRPVHMIFDGNEIDASSLPSKAELHIVFADLMAQKDTIKILADLNKSYPYPQTPLDRSLHDALGKDNHEIVARAVELIARGDTPALGALMTKAQRLFDEKVAPACPDQLSAPILHSVLNDPMVKSLTYGGKGVGSQGDGVVQLLAKDKSCQGKLALYLREERHMDSYQLTLLPRHSVRKAIIPVAGYGTRMYPATRFYKKEFFPVVDRDHLAKPVILVLLEELDRAGIEEFCLVINGDEDREQYQKFFNDFLAGDYLDKIPAQLRYYEQLIHRIGSHIEYVIQHEKRGFGHAVYQGRAFAGNQPVLLALGDTIYRSENEDNCTAQLLEAFEKIQKTTISIHTIQAESVAHYGVLTGTWDERFAAQRILRIRRMMEKPSVRQAEELLKMPGDTRGDKFFSVFGEYVLTPEVFEILGRNIDENKCTHGEIQLTDALEELRADGELYGFAVDGSMFDVGIPQAYVETVARYNR